MYKITTSSDNDNYLRIGNTLIVIGNFITSGNISGVVEAVDVTFPIEFSSVSVVFCTAQSAAPFTRAKNVTVADKTTTGFKAYVLRMDDNQEVINYLAIGEKKDED